MDIPKPGIPDVDENDIVDKGNDAGNWIASLSQTSWTIIVILIFAAIILWAVRRSPFLKGIVVCAVVGLLALAAFGVL